MQRILAAWFAGTVLAGVCLTGRAEDEPALAAEPEAVAADESAPPQASPPEPPAGDHTADGTTSVVVPAADAAGPATPPDMSPPATDVPATPPVEGAVALPPPPTTPASLSPSTPIEASQPPAPPATFTPPPPSESTVLLGSLLEPLAGGRGPPADVDPQLQLYARPLPLIEPLVRSGDRSRRLWLVQAYWKTATGYALLRSAAEALERLAMVAPGGDPYDLATLDVATAAARADLADAKARLGAAQQELVDLARLPLGEPLPWPVDRPLADPYQTHFEAIFANRIATGRIRAIVRSLPVRYEAVASRAAAVTAAAKATDMAEADHAQGKRPIEAVLAAHAALVSQRAAFLDAVRTYNLEIAEYAMAVADLSLPDEQFVSMLIATPIPWRLERIEPVSATALPPLAPPTGPPQAVALPPPLRPPPGFAVPIE